MGTWEWIHGSGNGCNCYIVTYYVIHGQYSSIHVHGHLQCNHMYMYEQYYINIRRCPLLCPPPPSVLPPSLPPSLPPFPPFPSFPLFPRHSALPDIRWACSCRDWRLHTKPHTVALEPTSTFSLTPSLRHTL